MNETIPKLPIHVTSHSREQRSCARRPLRFQRFGRWAPPGPRTKNQRSPAAPMSNSVLVVGLGRHGSIGTAGTIAGSARAAVAESANPAFWPKTLVAHGCLAANECPCRKSRENGHLPFKRASARADAFWAFPAFLDQPAYKHASARARALYGAILPTAWVSPATGFYGPSCASKNTVSLRQDRSRRKSQSAGHCVRICDSFVTHCVWSRACLSLILVLALRKYGSATKGPASIQCNRQRFVLTRTLFPGNVPFCCAGVFRGLEQVRRIMAAYRHARPQFLYFPSSFLHHVKGTSHAKKSNDH